ncbi:N-acetyltransferase [Herbaspirillum sp. HC18]|nr:N-acetyltransferase [Herbaspirillum sp. HC18]
MSFLIPESIESTRLLLRTVREEDWAALHEYYSDAESTTYTTLQPLPEDESRRVVGSLVRHWERKRYGPYILEEKGTGTVLGLAGLWYPKEWPEPEIKWALVRRHWGKGYAAEAARAVQAMAAQHMPELHLISLIHCENQGSIRVAVAVGATMEREMDFRGGIYRVYRHSR